VVDGEIDTQLGQERAQHLLVTDEHDLDSLGGGRGGTVDDLHGCPIAPHGIDGDSGHA
jgi:hypothetical protein